MTNAVQLSGTGDARFAASYLIETPLSLHEAAESLAGEQSSGTFVAVPGESLRLREQYRARVEKIEELEPVAVPSLPGAREPLDGCFRCGRIKVSWPTANVGTNLPTLLTTVCGNLSELREVSGVRLLEVELPLELVHAFPGPQFGVGGTRRLAGVEPTRPLVGTIVKPSVGLSPEDTAGLVAAVAKAGIDFIKDDELIANPPWSPLEQRVEAVMRAVDEVADRTGRKVMVAFNISDEFDAMRRHLETVVRAGGTCVMVSLNSVGLGAVSALRRECPLPIHGHRNGWGMLTRYPRLGMEFAAYQVFWRLAGVDQLHVNAVQGKFWESDDSVARSIRTCLTPLGDRDDRAIPVVSSGQWGGQAPETYRLTETVDLVYLAGGGLLAHPRGVAAGVVAIRDAWEAAVAGVPLAEYADGRPELAASLTAFGSGRRS